MKIGMEEDPETKKGVWNLGKTFDKSTSLLQHHVIILILDICFFTYL